jgi:hypothetical protein
MGMGIMEPTKMICYDECEFCLDRETCQGTGHGRNAVALDCEHELDRMG